MLLQEMVWKDEIISFFKEGEIAAVFQALASMEPDRPSAANVCHPSNI